jgi:predicted ATP-grasp superfamily ATP-dependent carboligase
MLQPNSNNPPVLVLSGHTIALGVVRSFGPSGIPVYLVSYDNKDMAQKSKYIKKTFYLPHPEKSADKFITGLIQISKEIGKAIVFAADDPTLVMLSYNLDTLKNYFIIPTPVWSVIKKVINKNETYAIAENIGVPVPKTVLLDNKPESIHELIKDFKFPCLIKPVQSHRYYDVFKSKMNVVNNLNELMAGFTACSNHNIDVTIQEIIVGETCQGFNFNSLFYNGKIKQGFTAYKVRMTDNDYGIPVVVRSKAILKELWDYSERILKAIGYEGYSCIEYKFDKRDGIYKLLEVNGRYNRSSLLSVKTGVNFPMIQYNYLINKKDFEHKDYKKDYYYIDEFKDIQVNIKNILTGKINLIQFIKPYFSKNVFAIFSLKDFKPFLKHLFDARKLISISK